MLELAKITFVLIAAGVIVFGALYYFEMRSRKSEMLMLAAQANAVSLPPLTAKGSGVAPSPTATPRAVNSNAAPDYKIMTFTVTAYCPCEKCCNSFAKLPMKTRTLASMELLKPLIDSNFPFVAADTRVLPFHTLVSIPDYHNGRKVPVLDRGGAIKGNRIDVFFPTHQQALNFGIKRNIKVKVWK